MRTICRPVSRSPFEPSPWRRARPIKTSPTEETSMPDFVRPIAAALGLACLAALDGHPVRERRARAGQTGAAEATGGSRQAGRTAAGGGSSAQADRADRKADRGRACGREGNGSDHRETAGGRQAGSQDHRAARRRRPEERLCLLRRLQQRGRQYQRRDRRLRSGEQEVCRSRSGHQGADRPGPGRQENAGQGQEGSTRRPQRGPEVTGARDRAQGQHRSGGKIL